MQIETLIDGYNLIFQVGLTGKTAGSSALEKARGRLLNLLASHLDEHQRLRTVVVFDAKNRPIKEVPSEERVHEIRVLFAVDEPDADSLIEKLIRQHSAPKQLLVVSSDHRVQTAASRRNAKAIDSDRWLDRLESGDRNTPTQSRRHPEKNIRLTDEEERELYEQFIQPVPESNSPRPDEEAKEEKKKSRPDNFDPFPPGYADDLLD